LNSESAIVFKTRRLVIRSATAADAQMLFDLWTDPRVMTNVGYPLGLQITLEEIEEKISVHHQNFFSDST